MTVGTRSSATDLSQRFGAVWPDVERSVIRYLQSRGLTADAAGDVAQEVAARALGRGLRFETAEDLTAWSLVVARRIAVDEHRRQRRLSVVDVPEHSASVDVEHEVVTRQAWDKVAELVASMSVADRDLLLDPSALPLDDRNRLYVRRHRLRIRLAAAAEGLVALMLWLRRRASNPRLEIAAGLAVMLPAVAVAGLEFGSGASVASLDQSSVPVRAPATGVTVQGLPVAESGSREVTPLDRRWHDLELPTPVGGARTGLREGERGAGIVCVHDDPVVPDTCVGRTDMVPTLIDSDEVLGP